MGKINMGIFYGKKYNSGNRTFSLENGENFIEGTGQYILWHSQLWSFQGMDTKLERFLAKNQLYSNEITFEELEYSSGELSKIAKI